MTNDELKHRRDMLTAFLDGKEVQWGAIPGGTLLVATEAHVKAFLFADDVEWRLKPKRVEVWVSVLNNGALHSAGIFAQKTAAAECGTPVLLTDASELRELLHDLARECSDVFLPTLSLRNRIRAALHWRWSDGDDQSIRL